jgi:hypothetical protein
MEPHTAADVSDQAATSTQPQQGPGTSQQGPAAGQGTSATTAKSQFMLFTDACIAKAEQLFEGPGIIQALAAIGKDAHDREAAASIQQLEAQLEAVRNQGIGPSATDRSAFYNTERVLQGTLAADTLARERLQEVQFAGLVVTASGAVILRLTSGLAAHDNFAFFAEGLLTAGQAYAAEQRAQVLRDQVAVEPSTTRLSSCTLRAPHSSSEAQKFLAKWVTHVLLPGRATKQQLCRSADGRVDAKYRDLCAGSECGRGCADVRSQLGWPDGVPCVDPKYFTKTYAARFYLHYAQHAELGHDLIEACPRALAESFRHARFATGGPPCPPCGCTMGWQTPALPLLTSF